MRRAFALVAFVAVLALALVALALVALALLALSLVAWALRSVNKLCLHVGHVLFIRNHCDKLSELNMCPQCLIRDTCCADSNASCVIEHTLLIGLTMFPNATVSTRSSNCACVSLRSSDEFIIPNNAFMMLVSSDWVCGCCCRCCD